jgi:hypothetical protein
MGSTSTRLRAALTCAVILVVLLALALSAVAITTEAFGRDSDSIVGLFWAGLSVVSGILTALVR